MSQSMVYQMPIDVTETDIDENGHVNNLSYVKWMLDVAVAHSDSVGCTFLTSECGATWIVRSHVIDYLQPIHLGDPVCIRTWISEFGKIRSPRKYEIVNVDSGAVYATGETLWVFLNSKTGRPMAIPRSIISLFQRE